jgi:hypothetical protein
MNADWITALVAHAKSKHFDLTVLLNEKERERYLSPLRKPLFLFPLPDFHTHL